MEHLKELEAEVSLWPNISVHPHRLGGKEFRCGNAEVGHVHRDGVVDIPFPRSVRDALLAEGLAEGHPWVPNSGWVSFRIRGEQDLKHALWLLRLSLLRYLLKTSTDPHKLLEKESKELPLSPHFQSLLAPFVPKTVGQVSAEPLSA
ncbi:MAG TPA: luciferase family protein [Terriglobales bacterium]|nr:luciferase family protein [Terriglobales bacterium]